MLDASHTMLNKFYGPSDANFGLVSNAIKMMVEKAKSIALKQREGIPCFPSNGSSARQVIAHLFRSMSPSQ